MGGGEGYSVAVYIRDLRNSHPVLGGWVRLARIFQG